MLITVTQWFRGAMLRRFLCVLVETAQIFEKVPFLSHQITLRAPKKKKLSDCCAKNKL